MKLCAYSRSTVLEHLILSECPLGLSRSEKDTCQCHRREYHVPPADLRVSSCTHPLDWRGNPVRSLPLAKRKIVIDMSDKTPEPGSLEDKNPATRPLFGLINGQPLEIPIIGLCGGFGSGKTLAGLTLCPEETVEVGIEDSGVTYQLPLKHRFSLYKEVTGKDGAIPKPIECWEWFQDLLKKISSGSIKCRVLFVDPITDIQNGLVDWVREHAKDFGKTQAQYDKASGLIWGDVKAHLKMLLGTTSRKMDTLIFTAHMGSVWSGGAPVAGKQKAKGLDTFRELASLYVYLSREVDPKTGKQPKIPVGIIAPPHGKSRLAHMVKDENGNWNSEPILPPRIETFTWEQLRKYVAKPPDYNKLKKDELVSVETLSDDEKLLLKAETARLELEAAQLKKEQMEMAAAAAERNRQIAQSTLDRAMAKPAVAPTTVVKEVKAADMTEGREKPAPAAKAEPKPEQKKESSAPAATQPAASPAQQFPEIKPWSREECMKIVQQQIVEVGMTPEQIARSLSKRGADSLTGLSDEKLEDFRRGLWTVLTAKAIEMERGKAKKA